MPRENNLVSLAPAEVYELVRLVNGICYVPNEIIRFPICPFLLEIYQQQGLRSLSDDLTLPSAVFFTSDADVAPWFLDCLTSSELGEFTGTGAPFDVTLLDTATMEKFSTFSPQVEKDPFIVVEALFADRIVELGHV